jgi:hypothetical protein
MLYSYNKIGNFLKRKIGFSNVGDGADGASAPALLMIVLL